MNRKLGAMPEQVSLKFYWLYRLRLAQTVEERNIAIDQLDRLQYEDI